MSRLADRPAATVVKIGGSLLGSPRLDRVLGTIVAAWHARPVIVAGGGPFADTVRETQRAVGFDDRLAHRLALAAMGHVGTILEDRNPTLIAVDRPSRIAEAHRDGKVPIWRPLHLQEGRADIPETWDVTSDSLALWLATQLGVDTLVLVKSADADSHDPAALAAAGVVDAAFPVFAKRFRGSIEVVGPASDCRLHALLVAAARHTGHAA